MSDPRKDARNRLVGRALIVGLGLLVLAYLLLTLRQVGWFPFG